MEKIMITGATGKLGGLTIDHLLNTKEISANQIIALVRDKKKAKHLAEKGIELRVGSFDDLSSLELAFKEVNKLLVISAPELDNTKRLIQNHNVVIAAKSAQVDHIFYVGLADPEIRAFGLEDVELATEHAIRAVNLPFTFIRNSTYLDEVAYDLKAAVKHGELLSSTNGRAFNYVLRKDLALVNATVLTEEGHKNKTYELVRSKLITFSEMAAVLSRIVGKEISYKETPSNLTIEKLIESGVKAGSAESIVNTFHKAIADQKFLSTSKDLEHLLGDQLTPLDKSIESLLK
ncbi:NmrA family NAD(P)-binding protein [Paenibacillus kribbensis]|uniref:NmrA family NAD(P)-binding protein n=1 Tax=Paenibacillus kribbensis TaxID=172713 RepID=UPI002DBA68C1|nr:NmrA family NAD(P)-binding protein [Paenibacillus kribbensis]MEC0234164.1 NmrA family NAD(P)-binding protein [Paenibacillus kribbensis]